MISLCTLSAFVSAALIVRPFLSHSIIGYSKIMVIVTVGDSDTCTLAFSEPKLSERKERSTDVPLQRFSNNSENNDTIPGTFEKYQISPEFNHSSCANRAVNSGSVRKSEEVKDKKTEVSKSWKQMSTFRSTGRGTYFRKRRDTFYNSNFNKNLWRRSKNLNRLSNSKKYSGFGLTPLFALFDKFYERWHYFEKTSRSRRLVPTKIISIVPYFPHLPYFHSPNFSLRFPSLSSFLLIYLHLSLLPHILSLPLQSLFFSHFPYFRSPTSPTWPPLIFHHFSYFLPSFPLTTPTTPSFIPSYLSHFQYFFLPSFPLLFSPLPSCKMWAGSSGLWAVSCKLWVVNCVHIFYGFKSSLFIWNINNQHKQ